jgi:hypothetical protein
LQSTRARLPLEIQLTASASSPLVHALDPSEVGQALPVLRPNALQADAVDGAVAAAEDAVLRKAPAVKALGLEGQHHHHRADIIIGGCALIGVVAVLMDRLLLAPLERRTIERWGLVASMREEKLT